MDYVTRYIGSLPTNYETISSHVTNQAKQAAIMNYMSSVTNSNWSAEGINRLNLLSSEMNSLKAGNEA